MQSQESNQLILYFNTAKEKGPPSLSLSHLHKHAHTHSLHYLLPVLFFSGVLRRHTTTSCSQFCIHGDYTDSFLRTSVWGQPCTVLETLILCISLLCHPIQIYTYQEIRMVPTLNWCLWTSRGPKSALLDELPVKMWDKSRALLRATSETTPGWCDSWHGLSLYTNNSVRIHCSTALSSPHEHFSKLLKPLFCRKTEKRWTRSGAKSSMTSQSTTALALPTPTYGTVAHYIMLHTNQPRQQCTPENWSRPSKKIDSISFSIFARFFSVISDGGLLTNFLQSSQRKQSGYAVSPA